MKVEKYFLHQPDLQEVASVLRNGSLSDNYNYVDVQVVDSPNFTKEPFFLASEGICGRPCLADVGGKEYLLPVANREKRYDFRTIAEQINRKEVSILAAGNGPWFHIGESCQIVGNLKLGETESINTRLVKVKEDKLELMEIKDNTQFAILANLYMSEGKPGKVIRVIANQRSRHDNFVSAIRKTLSEFYEDKVVGMGGVFLIKKGKAKVHVMPPEFSESPLKTADDVRSWLRFFNISAPLTCLSTFLSYDPGLNLLVEHTHCYSDHNEGGHYHEDTTTNVEYEGYFNVAKELYRIDQPSTKHFFEEDYKNC